MALSIYNAGLDALADWGIATYRWLLLTAGTFGPDLDSVAAVLAGDANEVDAGTVTSYARVDASTKVRTVDDTLDQITYTCADPSWGTLEAGATVTAVLLMRYGTGDADSVPVAFSTITSTATDALNPFVLSIADGIVAYVDQAA